MMARKIKVIAAAGLIGLLATGGFLLRSANRDPFRFLFELKPTVITPDSGFSLTKAEQRNLRARARLFLFYQPPEQVANLLKAELLSQGQWKLEDKEEDYQTYQDPTEGRAAMFGTGMPQALMSGPPPKVPTCYIVTIESPNIVDRILQFLKR